MDNSLFIKSYLTLLTETINRIDVSEISGITELLIDAYHRNANIFIMGNGGSASTASHFACDINKGVSLNLDKRFKVISLTDNLPTIMAYANDLSYEDIFIEQLKNFLNPGDLVIGISGSGNSKNLIKAIEYAKNRGNITIGFTGYDGGRLKTISDHNFHVHIDDMQISEDLHMILTHILMRILCEKLTNPE